MDTSPLAHEVLMHYLGLWQFASSLFAFLALMAIWWHLGRKKGDFGQVFLAFSVLCWAVTGGVEYLYGRGLIIHNLDVLNGVKSVFSLLNSFFILCSLPYFKYIPKRVQPIIHSTHWIWFIGIPFAFSLLPTLSQIFRGEDMGWIAELDFYYAVLTIVFLTSVLWASFSRRNLKYLGVLSILCSTLALLTQIYKLSTDLESALLLSAIFKSSFIMLFFALALSWVKEIAEGIQLESKSIYLNLVEDHQLGSKGKYILWMSSPAFSKEVQIPLSHAQGHFFIKLLKAKQSKEDAFLKIRSRSMDARRQQYDIGDHNEIRRFLHHLLDSIYGKGIWTKSSHELPLKKAFFEYSADEARSVRLKIPKENIETS